jgi:hypothetical protein
MDTKTGYIDPRFAVRENASIDLQLRAKTELKRKSKKTTSESAMAKQSTKEKKKADNTLSLSLFLSVQGGCRRSPEIRFCDSSRSPKNGFRHSSRGSGHQKTHSAFHPVTKEWILIFPASHQRTDSAIPAGDQVTREHILRVSTNRPINTDRIPGVLGRHRVT